MDPHLFRRSVGFLRRVSERITSALGMNLRQSLAVSRYKLPSRPKPKAASQRTLDYRTREGIDLRSAPQVSPVLRVFLCTSTKLRKPSKALGPSRILRAGTRELSELPRLCGCAAFQKPVIGHYRTLFRISLNCNTITPAGNVLALPNRVDHRVTHAQKSSERQIAVGLAKLRILLPVSKVPIEVEGLRLGRHN